MAKLVPAPQQLLLSGESFGTLGGPGGDPGDPGDPPGGGDPGGPDSTALIYFFHNDHLGTPLVMTDVDNTVVWQGLAYPFGEIYDEAFTVDNRVRFPGHWADDFQVDSLNYNMYRYYLPFIGRYISPDPIGLAGGSNLYSYVGGNPINYIDPWGLRYWTRQETEVIMREAGQQNEWNIWINHAPKNAILPFLGKYDYNAIDPSGIFDVCGRELTAGQFGNFLAGYAFYKLFGWSGIIFAHSGGIISDFRDGKTNEFLMEFGVPDNGNQWDLDMDSWEAIGDGVRRALQEERILPTKE